ncbi:L-threonine 3-dehydrogenase [Thermoflexus hugenholtzii]|jgi:L-threonine 3-dehydrogenase (EC 1.1.1.103)|uniref:L-threonine 3-dehydrogenase n=1 Tax=Thermoflexus hugenholtzii JAD2 TaxID=877466 RepID=A0A212QMH0_9CHLR|nr:L-threonine 3-dehydrogenase [Thermoflexus hugenholtzii]SNB60431.1 L-threonine 3-dehydrogenase [Thermoflexus hugenholtzii JAD2]
MTETMRAVVKAAPGPGLTMAQRPIPTPGPGEILVNVKAASICGTDLHIYRWDPWAQGRIRPPLIIGHEFCGEVVETGPEVDGIRVGDFISAESHVVCGRCDMCRTGKGHLCRNTRILGVDRDGAFADFIVIPAENAWVNPPDLPLEVAVLLENFGNAVHTAFAVDLRARKVLVTGCGPVGLMTIAVARAIGARMIIATDISPYRLELARRMGADHVLNPQEIDVVEAIRDLAGGEVDVLLEMSGAPSAIREGFAVLKPGGQAALLGLPPGPIEFDLANMVIFKGVTVHGIVGRRLWETWYEIRGLLNSGAVDLRPVVTHRFRLEEFDQAFATMASGRSGKVMLIP